MLPKCNVRLMLACLLLALSACTQSPPTFDKMNLQEGVSGIVPMSTAKSPPDVGQVSYERDGSTIRAFSRFKFECPQHVSRSLTGTLFEADRIVLCYELLIDKPGEETSLNGACPQDLLLQFEILDVPAEVEPKFHLQQGCPDVGPASAQ